MTENTPMIMPTIKPNLLLGCLIGLICFIFFPSRVRQGQVSEISLIQSPIAVLDNYPTKGRFDTLRDQKVHSAARWDFDFIDCRCSVGSGKPVHMTVSPMDFDRTMFDCFARVQNSDCPIALNRQMG